MNCVAILAVAAAMIIVGEDVRLPGSNTRLTGIADVRFDSPGRSGRNAVQRPSWGRGRLALSGR